MELFRGGACWEVFSDLVLLGLWLVLTTGVVIKVILAPSPLYLAGNIVPLESEAR